jgi:hypothetical protein
MGLTQDQQKRLDYLKMLVSVRVEEYFEAPAEDNTAIPFGDIEYELNQAARYVMRQVPRNISFFGSEAYDYGVAIELPDREGAIIPLPNDYLRFTRFKMAKWAFPANEYMSDVSSAYKQQQFKMRRGTNQKPAVFLVPYAKQYQAGTAPAILGVKKEGEGSPAAGDSLQDAGITVATIINTEDPDFVYIALASGSTYTPVPGNTLIHPESGTGGVDGYQITIRYLEGNTIYRQSASRQALEVYPYGDGQIETFDYVPYLKSHALPEEFEDILIWRATSSVLTTMRRYNDAEAALQQMAISQNAISTGMYGEERADNGQG